MFIVLSFSVIRPPLSEIDGLARLGDRKIFSKLVERVFDDGQINWGRIIVLFYAVGRLAVKVLQILLCCSSLCVCVFMYYLCICALCIIFIPS